MRKFLLKTALPAFGRYVTGDGRLRGEVGLDTIPRVPVMPDEGETLAGLNESGHYGLVRPMSRDYLHWLLESYFTPWAGAWLEASVYFWWVQTFTESGGGGGSRGRGKYISANILLLKYSEVDSRTAFP